MRDISAEIPFHRPSTPGKSAGRRKHPSATAGTKRDSRRAAARGVPAWPEARSKNAATIPGRVASNRKRENTSSGLSEASRKAAHNRAKTRYFKSSPNKGATECRAYRVFI
ncbi:hypothetical protein OH491_24240 [Termitidicoccus mucosus]